MIRTLRALSWLRWRLLINSLRGGQRRDRMEQISRALTFAVPAILVALSFGSFIALAVIGYLGGRAMANGLLALDMALLLLRIASLLLIGAIIVMAVVSPVQSSVSRYSRLLLLPISRRTLHVTEVGASLADPWILLVVTGLIAFAAGILAGGWMGAAIVAVIAAVALMLVLACLGSLLGFAVSWLVRSRRRGEWFTLVFVLGISLLSFLPAMFAQRQEDRARERKAAASRSGDRSQLPQRFDRAMPRWGLVLPSELFAATIRGAATDDSRLVAMGIGGLLLEVGVLFAGSAAVHARLLGSVESNRSSRASTVSRTPAVRLPLLGPAASAVALTQVRTAIRTVRGRLGLLLPGPMMALLVVMLGRVGENPPWLMAIGSRGYYLLGAAGIFTIYSFQSFTMNMFATDRAGLTLQFLAPVGDAELARGKVAGCGLVIATSLMLCLVLSLAIAPGGSIFLWISTLLGIGATYLVLSPIAVWFSALLPVSADLSKTGSGGNPHGLAMLVGTILVLIAAAPPALILVATEHWLDRSVLSLPLMIVWTLIVAAVAHSLVIIASRAIGQRRENLALVAQGK